MNSDQTERLLAGLSLLDLMRLDGQIRRVIEERYGNVECPSCEEYGVNGQYTAVEWPAEEVGKQP